MLQISNAAWPGVVGKGDGADQEPPISLDLMLQWTVEASVDGKKFDLIDLILNNPHIDPYMSDNRLRKIADQIVSLGLGVGSLVAPVWPESMGGIGASAMGCDADQQLFVAAVRRACEMANVLDLHGVRQCGVIRIDSAEFGIAEWQKNPAENTRRITDTFREAAKIAADNGQRLAAEGEICWAGMHSWKDMLDILEGVGMPEALGFQADMAHTYLYLMGYNAPEHALLKDGYSDEEFYAAYEQMVDKLRPWTIDVHVAQNDGEVHGAGSHDKTGKHCRADDPNGKLDITKCAGYWLKDYADRGMEHLCWDGCMFPNAVLEDSSTWNTILETMINVRDAHSVED